MVAASAGHVDCLKSLQQQGLFLDLDSPERGSAGVLRKLQVWEAANSACKASHAGVLSWLFASGWPADIDAHIPWHLRDVVAQELWDTWKLPYLNDFRRTPPEQKVYLPKEEQVFLPELQLYRYAMQKSSPACLKALLSSGCRSKWVCNMATLDGREDFWDLAVQHGCPFDSRSLVFAASQEGHLPILQRLLPLGLSRAKRAAQTERDLLHRGRLSAEQEAQIGRDDFGEISAMLQSREIFAMLRISARVAAEGGHADCVEALQNMSLQQRHICTYAAELAASQRGQLACLHILLGYVAPPVCYIHAYECARHACLNL
jgi:hypothetical protein